MSPATPGPLLLPYGEHAPTVDESVYLAPGATLVGDVTVGVDSSVWFGAVIRGDVMPIRIGARTSIQDNAVIHVSDGTHPTDVGDDVTVGHAVVLHGCRVADRVIVGIGSIVLDGAEIASDVILGAGSLVTPGTRIPGGVLAVGRPARPRRDLRDDERAWVRENARLYVGYRARYRSDPPAGGA